MAAFCLVIAFETKASGSVPMYCADVKVRVSAMLGRGTYEFEILAIRRSASNAEPCARLLAITAKGRSVTKVEAEVDPVLTVRTGQSFWAALSWLETTGENGAVSAAWTISKPRQPVSKLSIHAYARSAESRPFSLCWSGLTKSRGTARGLPR
jgi:hypothetical protein